MTPLLIINHLTRRAIDLGLLPMPTTDDDTILSHAEALAEIRRLRVLITDLEAVLAATRGTLAKPTPDDDQPATYTHNVPPNAPR